MNWGHEKDNAAWKSDARCKHINIYLLIVRSMSLIKCLVCSLGKFGLGSACPVVRVKYPFSSSPFWLVSYFSASFHGPLIVAFVARRAILAGCSKKLGYAGILEVMDLGEPCII